MKPQQMRPKYSLEQYAIAFDFPGTLEGEVTVTSEVISGNDPDGSLLTGLLFYTANIACLFVADGLPGCAYKVSCSAIVDGDIFTRDGIVVVRPTTAIAPPGFERVDSTAPPPAFPFTSRVASPRYAVRLTENITLSIAPEDGTMDLIVSVGYLFDQVSLGMVPYTGALDNVVLIASVDPEDLTLGLLPQEGALDEVVLVGDVEPEAVTVGMVPYDGFMKLNPSGIVQSDSVSISMAPIGGTLS